MKLNSIDKKEFQVVQQSSTQSSLTDEQISKLALDSINKAFE